VKHITVVVLMMSVCIWVGWGLSAADGQTTRAFPVELEVTELTPSYSLEFVPGFEGGEEAAVDGKWSYGPEGWAHTQGPYIWLCNSEKVSKPLELTYPVPNGEYDVWLGINLHTPAHRLEVQLGAKPSDEGWRWIQTPVPAETGVPDVFAGTQTVTDGKIHLWLRNTSGGGGYWTAIDNVKIGPPGFNPTLIGVDVESLVEPSTAEVVALREKLARSPQISQVVLDAGSDEAVLCIDITDHRTRPEYRHAADYLGGLDAGLPGDEACIILASHVYQNCAGRRKLRVGVERLAGSGPLLLEMGYFRFPSGSPRVHVVWDGRYLDTIDCHSEYRFLTEKAFVVPAEQAGKGRHLLEIRESNMMPRKQDFVRLDAVRISGEGELTLCYPRPVPPPERRARLRVYDARYRPDRDPGPDQLTLATDSKTSAEGRDFSATGSTHIYLLNDGPVPAENFRCYFQGQDLETLRHKFGEPIPDEPRVIWWRVQPRRILPGGHAEVTIRWTKAPKLPAKFTLRADDSSEVMATVPAQQPPFHIEYAAFSEAMDRLYIYLESDQMREDWDLGSIELDQAEVLPRCEVLEAGRYHRLAILDLEKPMEEGSFHLLSAADAQGGRHTVQVRAWRCFYPVGAFGALGGILNGQEGANVNSLMCLGPLHKPTLDKLAAQGARAVVHPLGPLAPRFRQHPGILGYFIVDEPDAHDDPFAAGQRQWLGRETQQFANYVSVLHDLGPAPTTLVVDMTTRPDNCFVYGQLVDMPQHDPYFPPDVVRLQIRNMLQAAAPKPVIAVLWAFSEGGGTARPSPAVIRMNVYSALGAGAKGISYFSYWFKNQGYGQVPELRTAVHRLNAELLQVAPYLAVSHPIATDIQVPEGVWARAVLCGDQALVLSLVNDKVVRLQEYEELDHGAHRSPGDIIGFKQLGSFDMQVTVPQWFQANSVALITSEGPQPLEFSQQAGTLTCHGVNIGAGAMVLIQ